MVMPRARIGTTIDVCSPNSMRCAGRPRGFSAAHCGPSGSSRAARHDPPPARQRTGGDQEW